VDDHGPSPSEHEKTERRLGDLIIGSLQPRSRRDIGATLAKLALGGPLTAAVDAEARKKGKKKPKPCPKGTKRCGKKCFNLQTDRRNCGHCGNVCGFSTVCENSSCVPGCTVCQSGCSFSTVTAAVSDAPEGATISVAPGVYDGDLVIRRDLTLQRCGQSGEVALRNTGTYTRTITVLAERTFRLEHVTVTRAADLGVGGGGIGNEGTTTIVDSRIHGCSFAPFDFLGGGIQNAGDLTVTDTIIRDNAAGGGGGIANLPSGRATLTGCEITGNEAVGAGGGIGNEGKLTAANCLIEGNESTGGSGGGIFNRDKLDLTGCTIRENHVLANGGGLYNFGAVTLEDCQITDNTSELWGGGFANSNPGASVTFVADCTISDNEAGENGGGIYNVIEGAVTFKANGGSTVSGNHAGINGGGYFADYHNTLTIEPGGASFTGNTAARGGGIYNRFHSTVHFEAEGGDVKGNTATAEGGGIFNSEGTVTLNGISVEDNIPDDCAGDTPIAGCGE
jgi:hypothetical protein